MVRSKTTLACCVWRASYWSVVYPLDWMVERPIYYNTGPFVSYRKHWKDADNDLLVSLVVLISLELHQT